MDLNVLCANPIKSVSHKKVTKSSLRKVTSSFVTNHPGYELVESSYICNGCRLYIQKKSQKGKF